MNYHNTKVNNAPAFGLAHANLAGFRVVDIAHATRRLGGTRKVAFAHQLVEGLGVPVFHCVKLLDSVLDVSKVDSFLGDFLGLTNSTDVIDRRGQRVTDGSRFLFFGRVILGLITRSAAGAEA